MCDYKVGDLSALFETSTSKSSTPKPDRGKKKKSLFSKMKENDVRKSPQSKTGETKQKSPSKGTQDEGDPIKAEDIKKALEMKAKIEEKKKKQNQEVVESPSKPTKSETQSKETPNVPVNKKKKKKKKKPEASETSRVSAPGFDPPPGIVHEAIANKSIKRTLNTEDEEENKPVKKKTKTEEDLDTPKEKTRNRYKPSHTKEEDKRTIFIGNLSLDVTEKELTKMFGEFGEIESMRKRCIPVKDPDQMKRACFIKKEFHPERHNSVCYIKYTTVEAAKKALVNNGKVVNDLHIRVDIAGLNTKNDTECTVFVANLPFDVEEEPLRAHFEDCGSIENVRIVRDRKTCLGKGIGYVKFTEKSSVYLALKLHDSTFQKRSLRVQQCNYDQFTEGRKRKSSDTSTPGPKHKAGKFKPGPEGEDGDKKIKKPKKAKGVKTEQTVFHGEKAKKLKKLKKKSNFKSNMTVFFPTSNAPTKKLKSFDKSASDYSDKNSNQGNKGHGNEKKHIRFNEKDDKSGQPKNKLKTDKGKNSGKESGGFENKKGKQFMKNKDKLGEKSQGKFGKKIFDKKQRTGENFTKNVPSIQNNSSKGKHTHFD